MNPLENSILKTEWAHSHLHLLYADVERVFGPKMQRIPGDFDMEKHSYTIRRKVGQPPWDEWGLTVGDIATNLRDSLDHIAYQFALQTTTDIKILNNIYFPILEKRNDGSFTGRTKHFKPEAAKEVERFQPYHAPQPFNYPLLVINNLARISKHRYINVMVETVMFNRHDIPIGGSVSLALDDTNVVAVVTGTPCSDNELKPETSVEPYIELVDAVGTIYHFNLGCLHDAYTIIAHDVIPSFMRILPEAK